jgi:hypothetical protein
MWTSLCRIWDLNTYDFAECHILGYAVTLELEFFLRPTVSRPVRPGIGPPFGTLDQILSCSFFSSDNYFILRSKAPSLTRKRVCSLQCNHSLVRAVTPNHTLPPHLRLCSRFVVLHTFRTKLLLFIFRGCEHSCCVSVVVCSAFPMSRMTEPVYFFKKRL